MLIDIFWPFYKIWKVHQQRVVFPAISCTGIDNMDKNIEPQVLVKVEVFRNHGNSAMKP